MTLTLLDYDIYKNYAYSTHQPVCCIKFDFLVSIFESWKKGSNRKTNIFLMMQENQQPIDNEFNKYFTLPL